MSTIPTPGNTIVARKAAGADQGPQPRIQFNDGANITITVANDPANNEIDITIAAAGGAGTAWLNQFYPASDPDAYKGTYASMIMLNSVNTLIRQTFMVPSALVTFIRADVIVIPNAGGNIGYQVATNFGQICANEGYQTHTDSIGASTLALTQDEIECIDITAALTGAAGGDIVGIEFSRITTGDTINEDVHFLGIIIQGAAE